MFGMPGRPGRSMPPVGIRIEQPGGQPRPWAAALRPSCPSCRASAPAHAEPLHHLLHLAELLDEAVDVTDRGAAAVGDAGAAAAVDDLGLAPLLRGHRADDRLDRLQLVVVDLGALQLLRHAGHHPQQVAERAHLLELLHLLEEVVEGELTLQQLRRGLSAWSFSKACSACSMRVSMSPMPRMRPAMRSGWNCSNASSFSPVEAKAIGRPMTSLTRQRGTTAGVAVELRHDHAVDLERLVERLGTPTAS